MAEERLKPISLHQEMQRSYLEYAMSVIVGRALPDARDGLKPVQRRILFAMHELGLTPERPYRKCARVVGDVLGKYHPHGDQAVYDALVRQVQTFSSRYPILDGHGNFGSIDDDPPAAMRYTETRLAEISSEAILSEIDSDTVDFSPNFDGSQQEPNVLPAQLPFLILNGCSGIAVGMATSIPPHNLNEVINALIKLIKNPDISDEKLLDIIPGPDFPTGGEILLSSGIKDTYTKGRGSIPMRGIAHIEEINPGKGKHKRNAIIITELPYQLNKASWIEKLADAVNNGKVNGIADIRDESDREGMRILVELRRDSDPKKILNYLYQKTSLQSNFGAILLALVNGQPVQLTLKELLINFLDFREHTIIRRTKYHLNKIKDRQEILNALIKAISNLRKVITLIEESKDVAEAKNQLIIHLKVNERQADGILGMPLKKLTGLEQSSLKTEIISLKEKRMQLELIIDNREILLDNMINEFKILKKKYGSKRRTKLIEGGDKLIAEKIATQRPNRELKRQQALNALSKDSTIVIQSNNQIKILNSNTLKKMNLADNMHLGKDNNPTKLRWPINEKPKILAISDLGKIGLLKWEFAGKQPGSLEKFLPAGLEKEKIINFIPIETKENISIGLLSSDGKFKRISLEDIIDMSNRATTIVKLKDHISLKKGFICKENEYLIIISNLGRILKIKIENKVFPLLGKLAQGPTVIRLFPGETIVEAISINEPTNVDLILVTKEGSFFKLKAKEIRNNQKGDIGSMSVQLKNSDKVVGAYSSDSSIIIKTNHKRIGLINQTRLINNDYNKIYSDIILLNANEKIEELNTLILKNEN